MKFGQKLGFLKIEILCLTMRFPEAYLKKQKQKKGYYKLMVS